jgi:ubiquitin carboxyl-terminal hydrolase 14
MLLGSTVALPVAPLPGSPSKTVDAIQDKLTVPPGLVNLGNTCYMNATLQCLSAIPELADSLLKVGVPDRMDNRRTVVFCLGNLFADLKKAQQPITPFIFLTALRAAFEQFGEADNHGYKQQDAEECWSQLINVISEYAPGVNSTNKFIEQFMSGEFTVTMQCKEAPEETESLRIESFNKLQVHIGGGYSTYMSEDILKVCLILHQFNL